MASVLYNTFFYDALLGLIDWDTEDIRVALVDDGYTPEKDDTQWTSGKDPFDSEVVGSAYTAGGEQLASPAATIDTTNDVVLIDAADKVWQTSTITAKAAVVYNSSHTGKNLIACFEFTENKSSANGDFEIQWNASGLIALSQS